MRHCLADKDIDALAAAAHGFVGADLAAVCDEAAMAALRRIIAFKQHTDPPSPLPLAYPQPQESYVSLNEQRPAWSEAQSAAQDQPVSSPQCRLTPTQFVQLAEGTPPTASLAEHAPDSGVAVGDTPSCMQPSDNTSAHAEPSDEAVGAASGAHEWQVRLCCIALTKHDCLNCARPWVTA